MPISQKDANHCIRLSYDDTEQAFKMIPSSGTSFSIELDADDGDSVEIRSKSVSNTVLQSAIDASVTVNSSSVDISNYKFIYISIVADSLDQADATVQLQSSSDNTNFVNVSGKVITLASGTTNDHIIVENAPYAFFRLVYDSGTNSAGTVTTQYNLKG